MSSSKTAVAESAEGAAAQPPAPKLPLPPALRSQTPGTWAYDTMSRRIDTEILGRTFTENENEFVNDPKFAQAYENFKSLRQELQNAETTPLRFISSLPDHMADDPVRQKELAEWNSILKPCIDNNETWLSAPWMIAEFYLYRRLMEATGYFDPKSSTHMWDPFANQKRAGLVSSVTTAEPILKQIETLSSKSVEDGFGLASAFALWGNKMDLSIWPTEADTSKNAPGMFQKVLASANDNLLHDDTGALVQHGENLLSNGGGMIDIVVDNAGFELIMDLALADYLIASGVAKTVTFQLKSHPTFVSDALEKDLREHVDHYANNVDGDVSPYAQAAGKRWEGYLNDGKWVCNEDSFWVQPPPMWEMPSELREDMKSRCNLAFIKGDANYRRLLGDLEWDYSAPFEDVVGNYFPCPVCALRTLKAEIGCGMEKEKVDNAKALDDEWRVNGRFGVVHFSQGSSA